MKERVQSIDIVRGLVMLIMALDHIRDMLHTDSLTHNPTDLASTSPAIFFTRWVTHICAPSFVFLSGMSVFLTSERLGQAGTRKYLLVRGLLLILFEFTLVSFGLWWDLHYHVILFNVLGAIGTGFILLSLLLPLGPRIIGILGVLILFLHDLAPLVPGAEDSFLKKTFMLLFAPGAQPLGGERLFVMGYPPIPWLGVMLAGYALGHIIRYEAPKRRKVFIWLGISCLLVSLLARVINLYGDPVPWAPQQNGFYSLLSFINFTKYPPSLQFCLFFMGIMFLFLAIAEGLKNRMANLLVIYGKVPLFYFVVHWYIIHPILFIILFLQGYGIRDFQFGFNFGRPKDWGGLPLTGVYFVWLLVVLLMFPLCKWYGALKEKNRGRSWPRYL